MKRIFVIVSLLLVIFLSACKEEYDENVTVTFDTQGGTEIQDVVVDFGTTINEPTQSIKEGYTFIGWYSDSNYDDQFDFTTTLDEDVTLVAKWEINTYTISFYDEGELFAEYGFVYNESLENLDYPDIEIPVGHRLVFDSSLPETMPANDLEINFRVVYFQSTINFVTNNDIELNPITQGENTSIELPGNLTREEAIFAGWYLDQNFEVEFTSNTMPIDDITLFAKWNINQYTITYLNWDETVFYEENIDYGTDLSGYEMLSIPSREGYAFLDWDIELPNAMPAENIVLTGMFTDDYLFEITNNEVRILDYLGDDLSVSIPQSLDGYIITSLGEGAFYSNQLISITIPENITIIGEYAFTNNALTSVTIPNSVTTIGNAAFANNVLTTIIIPENITIIGEGAFTNNVLTSVTIPESVTTIGNMAFYNNQLTSVTIPESVTTIGDMAFANNILTSVTIPESVTTIGDIAFFNNALTSITIPENVTIIGEYAFASNALTSITIPENVTIIGEYAFASNALTSVVIPNSVTTIGKYAFTSNALTSVTIPNSITIIGEGAFANNVLTSVTIPNSITTIGEGAFANNVLTSVTIPENVTTIGNMAFYNNQLISIIIPESVTTIGDGAFHSNQLIRIIIPENVTTIGVMAFYDNLLTSVIIFGNEIRFNDYWEDIGFPIELKPE